MQLPVPPNQRPARTTDRLVVAWATGSSQAGSAGGGLRPGQVAQANRAGGPTALRAEVGRTGARLRQGKPEKGRKRSGPFSLEIGLVGAAPAVRACGAAPARLYRPGRA